MKFNQPSFSFLSIVCLLLIANSLEAKPYDYDDDIYYNAAKAKEKAEKKAAEKAAKANSEAKVYSSSAYVPNVVVDYADPAVYPIDGSGLNVDVDSYNRRGQFLVADTVPMDPGTSVDTYAYTRRIEKFYNSDIVNGSNNQELIDSYYSSPSTSDINIYVVDASPWNLYGGWYSPLYSWSWNSRYWNSWYYSPSLSWGFYNPWYSWAWTPSWGWGGPVWGGPVWGGPGWGGPGWGGHRPPAPGFGGPHHGPAGPNNSGWAVNSPGVSRPRPQVSNGNNNRGTLRPGAFSAGANTSLTRPGMTSQNNSMSRPSNNSSSNSKVSESRGRGNVRASSSSASSSTSSGRSSSGYSSSSAVRSNSSSSSYRSSSSSSSSRSSQSSSSAGRSSGGSSGGSRGRR